jgi:hypothetical protein
MNRDVRSGAQQSEDVVRGHKRTVATTEQRYCQGTSHIRVVVSGDVMDHSGHGATKKGDTTKFRCFQGTQFMKKSMQQCLQHTSPKKMFSATTPHL